MLREIDDDFVKCKMVSAVGMLHPHPFESKTKMTNQHKCLNIGKHQETLNNIKMLNWQIQHKIQTKMEQSQRAA